MELNNKISAVLVIFLLAFLVVLHFAAEDESAGNQDSETTEGIVSVGQSIDLIIMNDDIILEKDNIKLLEEISITITIRNTGTSQAPNILVVTYLERNGFRTEIHNQTTSINANEEEDFPYKFIIPADLEPGNYNLVVSANVQLIGNDQDLSNNEASRPITIKPIDLLDFSIQGNFTYPGKAREIVVELNNKNNVQLNTTLNLYYYTSSGNKSDSIGIGTLDLEVDRLDSKSANFTWNVSNDIKPGEYIVWVEITDASDTNFIGASASVTYKILEIPDRSTTPVYLQMWFIVGLIALIIFFLTIILSLIGVIPQDRLPIQPALVVMALVIILTPQYI